jgi:hypothetical protein
MSSKGISTATRIARARVWRSSLTVLGVLALAAGGGMVLITLFLHQISSVSTDQISAKVTTVTTITGPGAPSTALITGFLAAGVVLLIVAAFFNRITELDFAGVSVKMVAAVAAATAAKADDLSKNDKDTRSRILKKTVDLALSEPSLSGRVPLGWRQGLAGEPTEMEYISTQGALDTATALVEQAAKEVEASPHGNTS